MTKKDKINQGLIRNLTDAETNLVAGGNYASQPFLKNADTTSLTINRSMKGQIMADILPDRKNREVVPTA